MKTQNQYVLITGGTSGIGYELAKVFGEHGYNLILVARSEDELDATANEIRGLFGVEAVTIVKDLFQPFSAFEIYEEVKAMGITVNILVNDAGQGVYGKFVESDIYRQLDII